MAQKCSFFGMVLWKISNTKYWSVEKYQTTYFWVVLLEIEITVKDLRFSETMFVMNLQFREKLIKFCAKVYHQAFRFFSSDLKHKK